MFLRGMVLAAVAVLISGCVTERSGADYPSLSQRIGTPRPGQARIVVFREKGYAGIADEGWDVKLDGTPLRPLKTGTFIYTERPAGHHDLSASMQLFSGDTHVDVAAETGRTYFFLARPSDKAKTLYAMSAAGGIAGLVVGAAVTSNNKNPGPLDFFPMDDASARDMMNDLRVSD
jgi:hypothetical protein